MSQDLPAPQGAQPVAPWHQLDILAAMKVADDVMNAYKRDYPKWWKRMDGTPILNDLPVRFAQAFVDLEAAKLAVSHHAAPAQDAVPDGFVLVPREPTTEMLLAGWNEGSFSTQELATHYRAMLAARPVVDVPAAEPVAEVIIGGNGHIGILPLGPLEHEQPLYAAPRRARA